MNGEQIYGVGFVAQHLQMDVLRVRLAFEEMRIFPCLYINDVPHYLRADLERLDAHVSDNRRVTRT